MSADAPEPLRRHKLSTRIWHWINLACVVVLFMSGLNISNAHRRLYWGEWGFAPEQAWLHVPRFPGWATIPGHYDLAEARDWHNLAAWIFALALLAIWVAMLANRHFVRDLATRLPEWKPAAIRDDILRHLRLDFDHDGGRYNFLQKLSYGIVLGVFLPMMVFTGMAISPGLDPVWGWFAELVGGRQSARSLHFVFAWAIVAFMVVHVALVLLNRPWLLLRSMFNGDRP